jgi:hypothetical protein
MDDPLGDYRVELSKTWLAKDCYRTRQTIVIGKVVIGLIASQPSWLINPMGWTKGKDLTTFSTRDGLLSNYPWRNETAGLDRVELVGLARTKRIRTDEVD